MLVLLLLAFSITLTIYRLTLPTDGWLSYEPDDFNSFGYIYAENVMGTASGLQPGDHLIAVEGTSLDKAAINGLWSLKPIFVVGNTVRYTIMRQGERLEVNVPLVQWQLSSLFHSSLISVTEIANWLGLCLFLGLGFLTFLKRPQNPAARALLVLSAAIFFVSIGADALPITAADRIDPISLVGAYALILFTFTLLLPPAFIRFALVFPHPKPVIERHPWLALLPYAVGGLVVIAFLMQAFIIGWIWTALSVLIAILILIHNAFTMRDAISRAQLRWGLGGMIVGLGMFLSTYIGVFSNISQAAVDFFNALSLLGFGVMGGALAVAILRYHLFDIDLIIRRTLQYSLLTGLLSLVYFGGVAVLQAGLDAIGGKTSPVIIVLTTLLVAAIFNPLRLRIQTFIDRRFYRQKYDAEKALAAFAEAARSETDLVQLSEYLTGTVQETLQPLHISLWLNPFRLKDEPGQGVN